MSAAHLAAVPLSLLLAAGLAAGCSTDDGDGDGAEGDSPTSAEPSTSDPSSTPSDPPSRRPRADGEPEIVATVATGLQTPWGLDFLPDGRAVVTERDTARVLVVTAPEDGGEGEVVEVGRIPETVPNVEAGLLGVAVSPDFEDDGLVYFYVCTADENQVVRAELDGDRLGEPEPVLTGIPNGAVHDGGRLAFGPDGYLYVTTGETGDASLARDRDGYAGKILRITPEGKPAPDNPFDTEVWSWGHRNVEGIAFDEAGNLWASEFGDSSLDELNLIEPGADHGWPEVEGEGGEPEYADPQLTWPVEEASPSGLTATDGYLWMAALRGERLWRITVDGRRAADPADFFAGELGRLRTVETAPDGMLWLTTSNHDGRGVPRDGDDRILLVDP